MPDKIPYPTAMRHMRVESIPYALVWATAHGLPPGTLAARTFFNGGVLEKLQYPTDMGPRDIESSSWAMVWDWDHGLPRARSAALGCHAGGMPCCTQSTTFTLRKWRQGRSHDVGSTIAQTRLATAYASASWGSRPPPRMATDRARIHIGRSFASLVRRLLAFDRIRK